MFNKISLSKLFMSKNNSIWTVTSILLIILTFHYLTKNIGEVDMLIENSGVFAPIVAIAAYVILAPTPVSTDPMTIFIGVLFGPILGVLIAWVGNTLGAFTEYFIGRRIIKSVRFSDIKEKLPFGLNKLPVNSIYVLTLGRAIPVYGGKVINLMAGIYEVSTTKFLWTTVLINLIGAVLLSFGGYGLIKLIHLR